LDNATGLALTTDPGYKPPASPGYALEKGHKEGPYIHLHANNYFLFYQTGGCCSGADSTYTIHVARATSITGPYSGDKTFYASKGSIHGPGHMGIYDLCGEQRFTYHYYPDTGGSVIGENQLVWGADGWPSVGAEATTALKICDAVPGTGGSAAGGTGSLGGAAGVAGSSSYGGAGGGSAGGEPTTTTNAGSSTSAGMANAGGSLATAGTASSAAGSATAGSSGDTLEPIKDDPAAIGCACSLPSAAGANASRALWLGAAALVLAARRRRRTLESS
jgi:MYXO-CTERM domain-containing protein